MTTTVTGTSAGLAAECSPPPRTGATARSARGPQLIALSSHDSTPWTYDAFGRRFGDRYHTLQAGEALTISATAGTPAPAAGANLAITATLARSGGVRA